MLSVSTTSTPLSLFSVLFSFLFSLFFSFEVQYNEMIAQDVIFPMSSKTEWKEGGWGWGGVGGD